MDVEILLEFFDLHLITLRTFSDRLPHSQTDYHRGVLGSKTVAFRRGYYEFYKNEKVDHRRSVNDSNFVSWVEIWDLVLVQKRNYQIN